MTGDPIPAARGEQTRQTILDASERLFLSSGFNGTSMRQIAKEAGDIAVGGIYNHFNSKEAIFSALLEDRSPYGPLVETINSIPTTDGLTMLREFIGVIRNTAARNMNFVGLVMIDVREFEGSTIRGMIPTIIPHFVRFIQRMRAAGGFREDLNLFVFMRSLVMFILGYVFTDLLAFPNGKVILPGFPDLDALFWRDALIDIYLDGVGAPDREGTDS